MLFFISAFAVAEENSEPQEDVRPDEIKAAELDAVEYDFEYLMEGRPDPFEPFLKPKEVADPNEIVDSDEVLVGMQLFEPGQLTLVAIMQTGGEHIAMVEDSTGKGYVLNTGMKIGRRGLVIGIDPSRVMIEETAVTRAKKIIKTRVDMVLKKEEEE
ncbi:MAG: hypothetical protein CSB24_00165 [Deltaproteobacteria bacterium]|nr:MAG: hypothetical protein CSB24_00165 [Deltaproteobacteria bacterium]